jgi:hypothetical protein
MPVSDRAANPSSVPPLPEGATMALWPLAALGPAGEAGEAGAAGEAPQPLYCSRGKWLHPLFDLLDLLSADGRAADSDERAALASAGELFLRDRVIGRAAAFLILRAGIRHAWADLVSDGAFEVFEAAGARLGGGERVPAIGCQTEALLQGVGDSDSAWALLVERRAAGRSS